MRTSSEGLDNRLLTPCLPWSVAKHYREFFVRLPELDKDGRVMKSEPDGKLIGGTAEAEELVRGLHGFVKKRTTQATSTNRDDEEEGAQPTYKADQKGWSDTVDDGSRGTKVFRTALPPCLYPPLQPHTTALAIVGSGPCSFHSALYMPACHPTPGFCQPHRPSPAFRVCATAPDPKLACVVILLLRAKDELMERSSVLLLSYVRGGFWWTERDPKQSERPGSVRSFARPLSKKIGRAHV